MIKENIQRHVLLFFDIREVKNYHIYDM